MEKRQVQIGKFIFVVPDNWDYKIDEGIFSIYDDLHGVGVIQISHYEVSEDINLFDEFYDFVSDNVIEIKKDDYSFYSRIKKIREKILTIEIKKENNFFIYGMSHNLNSVLFITYNCDYIDRAKETDMVYSFFENLQFLR